MVLYLADNETGSQDGAMHKGVSGVSQSVGRAQVIRSLA